MKRQPQMLRWHANYALLMCHHMPLLRAINFTLCRPLCLWLISIFKTLNAAVKPPPGHVLLSYQKPPERAGAKAFHVAGPFQPQNAYRPG